MDTYITRDEMDFKLDVTLTESSRDKRSTEGIKRLLERSADGTRKHLSARHRYTFRITGEETRKCITGSMACLADDRVVIFDYQWSQLKVFDEDYNFCFSTPCFPGAQIAHYTANQIILTNRDLHKVMFYAVEKNKITELSKTINLKYKAYALQYGNNHFGVLMFANTFYIFIFNEMGEETNFIRNHLTGTHPLKLSKYFAMDQNEKKVYISDQENYEIVCSSYSEEILFRVRLYEFVPCGIILLEKIIVVAVNSSHVIAIEKTEEGEETYGLITRHVAVPSQLTLQHKRKCILVGIDRTQYCDVLRSFQITWSE